MGGNLFKFERSPRADYLVVEAKVRNVLNERIGSNAYRIPRYYGDKPDFGDADIIVSQADAINNDKTSWKELQQQLIDDLNITQHFTKNGLWSTAVDGCLQVDFFLVPTSVDMECKAAYMSYNDLGNILGRLFRPFGLKYSDKGLYYVFRRHDNTKDNYKREFLVSQNWDQILSLVELDSKAWHRGFDTLNDMFDWVTTSSYFRASSYISPQSRIMKQRLKQRRTIRKFLEYLETNNNKAMGVADYTEPDRLNRIQNHFGVDLHDLVSAERQLEEDIGIVKAKFNFNLVKGWFPDLADQSIGKFLRSFECDYPRSRLVQMSVTEIEDAARNFYRETSEQERAQKIRQFYENSNNSKYNNRDNTRHKKI